MQNQKTLSQPHLSNNLVKVKQFSEQLIVQRNLNGSWGSPVLQTPALDDSINKWVDQTGNEIITVSTPGLLVQWMDAEKTIRMVMTTVMVIYSPAKSKNIPLKVSNVNIIPEGAFDSGQQWEPVRPK